MNWRLKYWRDFFGRKQLERDLDDEIKAHLAIEIQARIESGETPEAARSGALREMRSVAMVSEATRESWSWAPFERLIQDVRYAIRILRKSPVFAVIVVLSLAIGIGANTALFSLADAMLLRKLPLDGADELVFFDWVSGKNRLAVRLNGTGYDNPETGETSSTSFSTLTFQRFRQESQTLADVFAFAPLYEVTVSVDGRPDLIPGQLVSGNYFGALRIPIVLGRSMTDADDRLATPIAIISHRYWQRRFELDPGVLGKRIVLNGIPLTIAGVTAPGFVGMQGFGSPTDISIPLAFEPQLMQERSRRDSPWTWWLRVMGRVKPGIPLHQVQVELESVLHASGLEGWNSAPDALRRGLSAVPDMPKLRAHAGGRGLTDSFENPSQFLLPLVAISAILLLIVCVNVANLLLARSAARRREIGVRLALGAGRLRVIRQMLTETVLLSLAGGVLGCIAAYWGKDLLATLLPQGATTFYDLRIDPRVLAFTAFLSVSSGVLFGLAPALRATRENANPALSDSTRLLSAGRTRLSKGLLVAQVALSLVLLIGAGLFVRTLQNLQSVDLGFNPENLLLFSVNPAALKYDSARASRLYSQILERTSALPGVVAATFSDYPLVSNEGSGRRVSVQGMAAAAGAQVLRIRSNFFESVGTPILSGRDLNAQDRDGAPKVALVNETFARRFFPNGNSVGGRFGFGGPERNGDVEIVGVVKDVRLQVSRRAVPPAIYLPDLQSVTDSVTFAVRTAADPLLLVSSMKEAIRQIDSNVPVYNIKTQTSQIERGFAIEKVFAFASTFFGGIAVVLVCIGLFGLMSYSVERRTSEIGLRMALGARRLDVVQLIMRQTVALVLIGVALGIAAAFAVTRTVATTLFNVTPNDPLTIVLSIATMIAVACIAAYLPARRAARVDPVVALRCD